MLEKKLLTIACAAAILACGACFLPPPAYRPPRGPDLRGVQSIRVEAENVSDSHHLDPSSLASAVATRINDLAGETRVAASSQKEAGVAQSVLHFSVLSESMSPYGSGKGELLFKITISATLTKPNGEVAWQVARAAFSTIYYGAPESSPDVLKNPNVQHGVASAIGSELVSTLFYGHW